MHQFVFNRTGKKGGSSSGRTEQKQEIKANPTVLLSRRRKVGGVRCGENALLHFLSDWGKNQLHAFGRL